MLSNQVKKDALDQVTNTLIDMTREFYSKTDGKIVSQLDYSYGSLIPSVDQIDWDAVTDIWKKLDTIERDDELSVIRNDGRVMASTVDEVCGENVLTDDLERYKAASDLLKYIKQLSLSKSKVYHICDTESIVRKNFESIQVRG